MYVFEGLMQNQENEIKLIVLERKLHFIEKE